MRAETIFLGPSSSLWMLLAVNKAASRLYNRLYDDRLVVSTTRMVELATLRCTQRHMDEGAVAEYVAKPRTLSVDRYECVSDLPVVIRFRGKYFVLDGHHRLASKIVRGQSRAKVYLWDFDTLLASRGSSA